MNALKTTGLACLLLTSVGLRAQDPTQPKFAQAADELARRLDGSVAELNDLRAQIVAEKIPLSRELTRLESELVEVRREYQQKTRLLDSRTLDLNNLGSEIKSREAETTYLSNLLGEYLRNFESQLHISELHRYGEQLEAAKLAPENSNLTDQQICETQATLLATSLERLREALGGTRFKGTAVDPNGLVQDGTFAMIGPAALFLADNGREVGTAEQRLGSLEPTVLGFAHEEDAAAATAVLSTGSGDVPIDTTLGNAHKIEAIDETFFEEVQKGGPVMVPIFAIAGAALLLAILKWLSMAFLRRPSKRQLDALYESVEDGDENAAKEQVAEMRGPVGKLLRVGVEHLHEPRELIEEVMFEDVLTTRLRVQGYLPFIAITAASAPLLGLLGTVTGIINTFAMITEFGSGDASMLSGGISEALITTKYGLIVAIPSLLLHAFLSRKARRIINGMESAAVAFVNHVSKMPQRRRVVIAAAAAASSPGNASSVAPDPLLVRAQVNEILGEMLGPLSKHDFESGMAEPQRARS